LELFSAIGQPFNRIKVFYNKKISVSRQFQVTANAKLL